MTIEQDKLAEILNSDPIKNLTARDVILLALGKFREDVAIAEEERAEGGGFDLPTYDAIIEADGNMIKKLEQALDEHRPEFEAARTKHKTRRTAEWKRRHPAG